MSGLSEDELQWFTRALASYMRELLDFEGFAEELAERFAVRSSIVAQEELDFERAQCARLAKAADGYLSRAELAEKRLSTLEATLLALAESWEQDGSDYVGADPETEDHCAGQLRGIVADPEALARVRAAAVDAALGPVAFALSRADEAIAAARLRAPRLGADV